jgi:hypothetical protein
MPDQTMPADQQPSGLERSLVRLGRVALGVLYVGVALLGVLHLDFWTTLLVAPLLGVLATGLRWSIHQAVHPHATPSVALLLPAATVGALFAPVGVGTRLLGDSGAHLFLVLIGLVTALGAHWFYRLEVPVRPAAVDDRSSPPPPRPTEAAHPPPHELLRTLTLEDLIDEWRRSDELFHRASPTDRQAAVEWRGGLLDELQRRDPRGFDDWAHDGTTRGPEHHLRAGADRAATGPDDPPR